MTPPAQKLNVYLRLLGYLKPYRVQVALVYGSMLIGALLRLFVPEVVKRAIDNGIATGRASELFVAGGVILGIALASGAVSSFNYYYGFWLSHRVAYDLRNAFYNSVQHLPFAFHDQAHTGDLMSRATSDISEAEWFVGARLAELVSILATIVGVVTAMFLQDGRLALLALLPLPLLLYATVRFGATVRPMFKGIQTQLGVLSSTMQESLTGINVVKAFAREPHELDKFDDQNRVWYDRRVDLVNTWANNWPFFTFLVAVSIFLLLFFGGPAALRGEVTVGELFALVSYVLMLQGPVQMLGFVVNLTATAGSAAGRVFEIMDTVNPVADRPHAAVLPRVHGDVTFDQVRFGYRTGQAVLDGVSFHVPAGQKVALVGPTGSGKSTITNLLPRFYEPDSGRLLIDGQDIRYVTTASLRRQIGTVLQDSFLFSSTIAENIAYGRPDASQTEIEAAARAARAHDFIMRFPDGYNTAVGERGVTLSGGQKQRIAIARTLLVDPRILILDDATSSVDTETEYLIQQALQTLMEGRTTFIIAQRLLTLKHADVILVIEHGRIVQRGTHEELLREGGLYRAIYDLQLKDQEDVAALAM